MAETSPAPDRLFIAFQEALAGRYSLDRELGRGGMGVVYLAREVHLDRLVAIKVLPPERAADAGLRERFLTEARLAAKLSHPNIIPIHAVAETGAFVYYAMAFIDGETLAQRVRTRGPLPGAEGTRVLREVAWALAYAHSNGVVHRDVKPDNILLERATNRVLVADFGIAAATHQDVDGKVSGTPEFMSPEQALGKETTPQSDLYALGVTAFYMFTGRLPFEGRTPTEVLAKQVTEQAPAVSSMGMPVPRKVAVLVDRCVMKDPKQRVVSADALAEQLGVALEQRREVPAALRAFVKRNGRLDSGGTLVFPAVLLTSATAIAAFAGEAAGIASFIGGLVAVPMGFLAAAARKLMRLGFTHADVGPAFAAAMEAEREERVVVGSPNDLRREKLAKQTMKISGIALVASLFLGLVILGPSMPMFFQITAPIAGVILSLSALAYGLYVSARRDLDMSFWGWMWRSPIGKLAFTIGRRFIGKGARETAITHRATELSLSLAAESLYASLPAATRKSLGDLPSVVKRLHEDAQRLRKLHDELQDAVASTSSVPDSEAHQSIRASAESARAKLGAAVGALETIRLNLLRLHAGSGSVEGLTTHLDLAAEMSAEIGRLLAARDEVERGLEYPREVATTPA
ncbi:MAG TPA: serine/threonine-protein kinase [Gemmatimonadaceae bacterium]|nr:serine/threonine-protein kinase [Gemmatimonadaceae bacterium]